MKNLTDAIWNNEKLMSLNAELGLTMDQLVKLAECFVDIDDHIGVLDIPTNRVINLIEKNQRDRFISNVKRVTESYRGTRYGKISEVICDQLVDNFQQEYLRNKENGTRDNELLVVFEDARNGSGRPSAILRGILAVISKVTERN